MAEFTPEQRLQLKALGFHVFPNAAKLSVGTNNEYYVWCARAEDTSFADKPDGFYADPGIEGFDYADGAVRFDDPIAAASWLLIEASNLTNSH